MNVLPKFSAQTDNDRQAESERSLLRNEAAIGGKLFGPIPKGHRRQFFCMDEHTWVWHEEWLDKNGQRKVVTTRYNVRPDGILKSQNGHGYQRLSRQEARNLVRATRLYYSHVGAHYQSLLQTA